MEKPSRKTTPAGRTRPTPGRQPGNIHNDKGLWMGPSRPSARGYFPSRTALAIMPAISGFSLSRRVE